MVEARLPYRGLVLLGRAFREQSSGVLSLGRAAETLCLVLRQGHIAAVVFPEERPPAAATAANPDDSAQMRLERLLSDIGIRPAGPRTSRRAQRNLRERMLAGLLDTDAATSFAHGPAPAGAVEVAGATEPLILEAITRVPDPQAVREGLGDLEQRLVATAGLAEERTLTLTEGYILSRVDGAMTAREVMELVPLEPQETERTLLGLLLTGRLEYRPVPAAAETVPVSEQAVPPPSAAGSASGAASAAAESAGPAAEATAPASEAAGAGLDGTMATTATAPPDESPSLERAAAAPEEHDACEEPTAEAASREAAGDDAPGTAEPEPAAAAVPSEDAERPPASADARTAEPATVPAADGPAAEAPAGEPAVPAAVSADPAAPSSSTDPGDAAAESAPVRPEVDHAAIERRRELLDYFQSLPTKNHFEVLGVELGCTDAEVKRAYASLARKYHPDTHRLAGLEDLHDVFEAIFIRVGEAWEVLGDKRSRTSYEARFPPGMRRRAATGGGTDDGKGAGVPVGPPPAPEEEPEALFVASEETLTQAQLLLAQAKYWDAIQMLEQRLPQMPPSKQQRRGRILLARAYAKNPNWMRKAEEALQQVVREEPGNADAHYDLGLLYKSGGMLVRAQASFRRALEIRPDHREAAAELGVGIVPSGTRPAGGLLKRLFGRGKAS
jgi:tetratricopeptide (TPR) repeat protein